MENRNRAPAQFRADPCRETFRDRLLGGEARRIMFVRLGHARTIPPPLLRKNALEKTRALPLQHAAHTFHLDQIAAEPNQNAARWKREIHGSKVASSESGVARRNSAEL